MPLLNNPACEIRPEATDSPVEWCKSYDNVVELAEHLVHSRHFSTPREVLTYFCRPWRYTTEWRDFQRSTNVMEETDDAVRALPPTDKITPLSWGR